MILTIILLLVVLLVVSIANVLCLVGLFVSITKLLPDAFPEADKLISKVKHMKKTVSNPKESK